MLRPVVIVSAVILLSGCGHEAARSATHAPAAPAAPAAPVGTGRPDPGPSVPREPVMVDAVIGHALAKSPAAPEVPAATRLVGGPYTEIVKICVDEAGSVTRAIMLKGSEPSLDESVVKTVRRWKFRPYLQAGVAVPFCFPARFDFKGE